jgi:hypothetical protein
MVWANAPTEEKQMKKLSVLLAGSLSAGLSVGDVLHGSFTLGRRRP